MDVTFLGARLPLAKTYLMHEGMLTETAYPHVARLTSFHENVAGLKEWAERMRAHADAKHCLFNGVLQQPLVDESRAQKTHKDAPRTFVVFDFDRVGCASADDVIRQCLPAYCHNVSYIAQASASQYKPDCKHWSGHIFMLLKKPMPEANLKTWLEYLNFSQPTLEKAISLTDSGIALHWPLDRTAAENSRLIYIAPPTCVGFTPKVDPSKAIAYVKRRRPSLEIPSFDPVPRGTIDTKINDLRTAANLPSRAYTTRPFADGEVLVGAEPGVISDLRAMGDHYIKFNLNGGDSLAYWIDLRNPALIKNFKGEPWLLTRDVDEKFYKRLAAMSPTIVAKAPLDEGSEVLAFYATNAQATIKTGIWEPIKRQLRLDTSTQTAAAAWLATYGIIQKGYLPHCDVVFDPRSDIQYISGLPIINTFRKSDYMMKPRTNPLPSSLQDLPPVIAKTMRSMLGGSEVTLDHFTNWLAYIFQTRTKSGAAWVLSGVEGTGKSKFVECVLVPLFGQDLVRVTQFTLVNTQFNAYMENALIVVFEEATIRAVENNAELMAKLKHWITEPRIAIHAKGRDPVERDSYCNLIFNSNERDPVMLPETNRRFNIADRQDTRLVYTPNEYITLAKGDELDSFADLLQRWPVNEANLRKVVKNETADAIHEQTTPINALIAEAIRQGDVEFFLDRMPSDTEANGDFYNRFNPLGLYRDLIDRILAGKDWLTYEDLYILFRMLVPDPKYFKDSKTWRMRHFHALGLKCKRMRVPGDKTLVYGMKVEWRISKEAKRLASDLAPTPASNVVNLR